MLFDFPIYSLVFFIGACLGVYLACVTHRRRPSPGSVPLTLFILAVTLWVFAYGLEMGSLAISDRILWAKVEYCGIVFTGLAWLCFALDYTGNRIWKTPAFVIGMGFIPVISLIMVWTNDWHGWVWSSIYPITGAQGFQLKWEHGFWFWLILAFQYAQFILGLLVLGISMKNRPPVYRRQVWLLIAGTVIPILGNIAYIIFKFSYWFVDFIPLIFLFAGVFYVVTIRFYKFLDVVPVARGALVESLPDGIIVTDVEGKVLDINPAAAKMAGSKWPEELGKPLENLWAELAVLLSQIEEGSHFEMESEKGGARFWLDVSLTTLRDRKRTAAGHLIVLRDVTYRRQMERNLRESEARYSTLVEQSNEGVLIVQDGEYKFANRTLAEMLGYAVNEIVGQKLPFLIADICKETVVERYKQRQAGLKVLDTYETHVQKKSGELLSLEISIGNITYTGKVARIVTARDITERRLTQRKLEGLYQEEKKLRASLQEEIEKRARYTRALVHELNTPLTSILASGELLEAEIREGTLAALVANVRRSSFNLKQRIDELIELARGETGLLKIKTEPVEMVRLLWEVVSETQPLARKKGLEMELKIEGDLPLALGDWNRLRQVLFNLIGNSLKFTQRGKVEVRSRKLEEYIEVSVQDSGRGIGKEEMEYLFDPYRRKVNTGQELGGLGIGLALSKMIIELHGGTISSESTAGQGSTFRFTVPTIH
jgi:PAS domain S-box-containing protein